MTPSWWTDLWLNEGFATYMMFKGAEAVSPELAFDQKFQLENIHGAMSLDALSTSHPVSVEVGHQDEIAGIFDAISYKKGASIVQMKETFLGIGTFSAALANYFQEQ